MISKLIGKIVKRPAVWRELLDIAMTDPDEHILAGDGSGRVYMYRYWLFNRIDANHKRKYRCIPFSIRIHRIMMPDNDRHFHDHPFNARTWIMSGGYDEVRLEHNEHYEPSVEVPYRRVAGDTSELGFEKYHRVTAIHDNPDMQGGGAITLFKFGPYLGPWGFWVDGKKMLRAEYARVFKGKAKETPDQGCDARQRSDAMVCERCDIAWDMNDPYPPTCGKYTGAWR